MPYDSKMLIDKLLNVMIDNKLELGSKILYITKKKLVFTINIILKKPSNNSKIPNKRKKQR